MRKSVDERHLTMVRQLVNERRQSTSFSIPLRDTLYAVVNSDEKAELVTYPVDTTLQVLVFPTNGLQSLGRATMRTNRPHHPTRREAQSIYVAPNGAIYQARRTFDQSDVDFVKSHALERLDEVIEQKTWRTVERAFQKQHAMRAMKDVLAALEFDYAFTEEGCVYTYMDQPVFSFVKDRDGMEVVAFDREDDLTYRGISRKPMDAHWTETALLFGFWEFEAVDNLIVRIKEAHGNHFIQNNYDHISKEARSSLALHYASNANFLAAFATSLARDISMLLSYRMKAHSAVRDVINAAATSKRIEDNGSKLLDAVLALRRVVEPAVVSDFSNHAADKGWDLAISPFDILETRARAVAEVRRVVAA